MRLFFGDRFETKLFSSSVVSSAGLVIAFLVVDREKCEKLLTDAYVNTLILLMCCLIILHELNNLFCIFLWEINLVLVAGRT